MVVLELRAPLNDRIVDVSLSKKDLSALFGGADHKQFYDRLSLMNLLDEAGFETVEVVTNNHAISILRRWFNSFDLLHWQFYPMSRVGHSLCLIAKKAHSPRFRSGEAPRLHLGNGR
jgi:hypothetical protein